MESLGSKITEPWSEEKKKEVGGCLFDGLDYLLPPSTSIGLREVVLRPRGLMTSISMYRKVKRKKKRKSCLFSSMAPLPTRGQMWRKVAKDGLPNWLYLGISSQRWLSGESITITENPRGMYMGRKKMKIVQIYYFIELSARVTRLNLAYPEGWFVKICRTEHFRNKVFKYSNSTIGDWVELCMKSVHILSDTKGTSWFSGKPKQKWHLPFTDD